MQTQALPLYLVGYRGIEYRLLHANEEFLDPLRSKRFFRPTRCSQVEDIADAMWSVSRENLDNVDLEAIGKRDWGIRHTEWNFRIGQGELVPDFRGKFVVLFDADNPA